MADKLEKQHERALLRFDRAYNAQKEVRDKCIEATRFARIPGAQWEGATAAGTKLNEQFEKYPKFEINKVSTELNRIISEYRNNRITVKFRPGDKAASSELADKLNGLFRADFQETDGGEACDNAFDDAATGGFGCFRFTTKLVNELDPLDKRMRIAAEPKYDAARSIWYDPDAKKYDKSDANWCFDMYSISTTKYEEEYNKKTPASLDNTSPSSTSYDWFDNDVVYIAKYYEIRNEPVDIISYQNPITNEIATYDGDQIEPIEDELQEAGFVEVARRKVKKRRVYVSIIDGEEFLEEPQRIAGDNISLIPTYGKRWFIDDVERVEGHVAKAMDPQRLYNLEVSMLADMSSQDTTPIPIVDMEQIKGLEDHWAARSRKRPAFLPLRPLRDKSNNIIAAATVPGYTQPPAINSAMATLLQLTSSDIQEVTGSSQAMQQMPSNIAQETVNNLMNRADMVSFIYLDNMAKSMKRAGEVWLSMAREVYGSDREVRVVNEDGSDDVVVMSAEVKDEQTGEVIALNDLSVGRYDVIVDVGPSYTARRDATVAALSALLPGLPPGDPMRQMIMGIIIDNMDGEGMDDIKEFNRKQLLLQGVVKPRTPQEKQMVAEAQASQQQQPDPNMVAAMAQDKLAQAEIIKAQTSAADTQVKAFTAQNDAMETAANTALKLAQAESTKKGSLMDALKMLSDFIEKQQQQIPEPAQPQQSQYPADFNQ